MEQNTQSSENNTEIKLDSEGEPVISRSEKKINKKIIFLIVLILVVINFVVIYFFLLNKEDNSELPVKENVGIVKDEEAKGIEIDKKLDTDQDGLPDYLEKIIGTDEKNSDTDEDSYNDFEEIKNGYNPLNTEKYTEEEWGLVKGKIKKEGKVIFGDILVISDEVLQKAVAICQKMEDEDKKNLCFALTKNNPSECEDQPEILKEGCCLMYAFLDNDASLCDKRLDSELCSAIILKDDSICETSSDIDACYSSVASSKKDVSSCEKFNDESMQNFCISSVEMNIEYCKNMEDEDVFKEMCFLNIAKGKNDVSIYSELKSENKNNCIAFVNKDKNEMNCGELDSHNYCTILGTETLEESFCDLIKVEDGSENSFYNDYFKNVRDLCRLTVASSILSTLK
ncbi:MAG: hypothetical protein KAI57_00805 [Candidatus Pacebacteria bacterium]|nr:hypothetical protein [Candidatus Paceibacterota bacterium]